MEISEAQQAVHEWAESKKWNDLDITDPEADPSQLEIHLAKIALIHMKLSEELESLRTGGPPGPILDALCVSLPPISNVEGINAVKVLAKLALVHSEVSEAVGAVLAGEIKTIVNGGKPEGLGVELQDTNIRMLHLAAMLGLDAGKDFALKMEFNASRPVRHGKLA